jgi:hypothetical protein
MSQVRLMYRISNNREEEGDITANGKVRCGYKRDTKPGPVKRISIESYLNSKQ